ncbi:hypothetical protein OIU77_016811 [Salix suchowensis]|uniref:Uncharacterized protein n=1 Tax=Salix suchowensis TaxID=1278906 RepID=A0ABQ8ZLL4_9ROSI|nr:hypothetical protein OIU77_016811 [Salix suchowensis]
MGPVTASFGNHDPTRFPAHTNRRTRICYTRSNRGERLEEKQARSGVAAREDMHLEVVWYGVVSGWSLGKEIRFEEVIKRRPLCLCAVLEGQAAVPCFDGKEDTWF